MGEMRKDSILERFMIISSGNGKVIDSKKSPYSPGNEAMFQTLQDSEDSYFKGWTIRVFENKNPAVSITTENTYSDKPHYSEPAYGYHYIVVASPNQNDSFATIDETVVKHTCSYSRQVEMVIHTE